MTEPTDKHRERAETIRREINDIRGNSVDEDMDVEPGLEILTQLVAAVERDTARECAELCKANGAGESDLAEIAAKAKNYKDQTMHAFVAVAHYQDAAAIRARFNLEGDDA